MLFAADRSIQRAIMVAGIIFAVLALPFIGAQHCQVMHGDYGSSSTPLAEACCVVLCFTALVGLIVLPQSWLTIARAALDLKPVCLACRPTRWVPPPRPIASLV